MFGRGCLRTSPADSIHAGCGLEFTRYARRMIAARFRLSTRVDLPVSVAEAEDIVGNVLHTNADNQCVSIAEPVGCPAEDGDDSVSVDVTVTVIADTDAHVEYLAESLLERCLGHRAAPEWSISLPEWLTVSV